MSYPSAPALAKHDIYGDKSDAVSGPAGLTGELLSSAPPPGLSKISTIYSFDDAEGSPDGAEGLEARFGPGIPCLGTAARKHSSVRDILRCFEGGNPELSKWTVWRQSVGVKRADGELGGALDKKSSENSARFAEFMENLDKAGRVVALKLGRGRVGVLVPAAGVSPGTKGAYHCSCYFGPAAHLQEIVSAAEEDDTPESPAYAPESPCYAPPDDAPAEAWVPPGDGGGVAEAWAPPETDAAPWEAPAAAEAWAPPETDAAPWEAPETSAWDGGAEDVAEQSNKRARSESDEGADDGDEEKFHTDQGAAQADAFYSGLKREQGTRADSRLFHMRSYNGWVKATQIAELNPGNLNNKGGQKKGPPIRVLDLACGKGGDLGKWILHARGISNYVGADVARGSLKDAAIRAAKLSRLKNASFICADLGEDVPGSLKRKHRLLTWTMTPESRNGAPPEFVRIQGGGVSPSDRFDVVSIQFAIHYMMQTLKRARRFFRTVADLLEVGGNLVATTVDARVVTDHIQNLGKDLENLDDDENVTVVVGGGACRLKFTAPTIRSLFRLGEDHGTGDRPTLDPRNFGLEYTFTLVEGDDHAAGVGEAVDLPEWLIPLPVLTSLAAEAGLELTRCENFAEFFKHRESPAAHPSAHNALYNMHVVNRRGSISADEWEISRLYMAVKFTKVRAASTVFEDSEDEEEANGGEEVPPVQVIKPPNNMMAILKAKKLARASVGDNAWSALSSADKNLLMQKFM